MTKQFLYYCITIPQMLAFNSQFRVQRLDDILDLRDGLLPCIDYRPPVLILLMTSNFEKSQVFLTLYWRDFLFTVCLITIFLYLDSISTEASNSKSDKRHTLFAEALPTIHNSQCLEYSRDPIGRFSCYLLAFLQATFASTLRPCMESLANVAWRLRGHHACRTGCARKKPQGCSIALVFSGSPSPTSFSIMNLRLSTHRTQ
jgi:hypothetical protein